MNKLALVFGIALATPVFAQVGSPSPGSPSPGSPTSPTGAPNGAPGGNGSPTGVPNNNTTGYDKGTTDTGGEAGATGHTRSTKKKAKKATGGSDTSTPGKTP